jgi:hypothetical protein
MISPKLAEPPKDKRQEKQSHQDFFIDSSIETGEKPLSLSNVNICCQKLRNARKKDKMCKQGNDSSNYYPDTGG